MNKSDWRKKKVEVKATHTSELSDYLSSFDFNFECDINSSFLKKMECLLRKELDKIGKTKEWSKLLDAHQKVFNYFIDGFNTYKPILLDIKSAYEKSISTLQAELQELRSNQQALICIAEQSDVKLMELKKQKSLVVERLKKETVEQKSDIDQLIFEKRALEAQVSKLSEELSVTYKSYQDEKTARKLLIVEIGRLRRRQDEEAEEFTKKLDHYVQLSSKKCDVSNEKNSKEPVMDSNDPVILKIALKNAMDKVCEARKVMEKMRLDYWEVVPKKEFESIKDDNKILNENLEKMQNESFLMQTESRNLSKSVENLIEEKERYRSLYETTRNNYTPRPDWISFIENLSGTAIQNIWEVDQSTCEKVQVLISLLETLNKN